MSEQKPVLSDSPEQQKRSLSAVIDGIHAAGAKRHLRVWFEANRAAVSAMWATGADPSDPKMKLTVSTIVLRVLDEVKSVPQPDSHAELLAALQAADSLLMKLCTVALNDKIADFMPYGLTDEVREYLRTWSGKTVAAIEHATKAGKAGA